jgi:hypothetical protein
VNPIGVALDPTEVAGNFVVGIVEGVWSLAKDRHSGARASADSFADPSTEGQAARGPDALHTLTELVRFAVDHPDDVLQLVGGATAASDASTFDRSRRLGNLVPAAVLEVLFDDDRSLVGSGASSPDAAPITVRLGGSDRATGVCAGDEGGAATSGAERLTAVAARSSRLSRVAAKLDSIAAAPRVDHADGDDLPDEGGRRDRHDAAGRRRRRDHDVVEDVGQPVGAAAELSSGAQLVLQRLRREARVTTNGPTGPAQPAEHD